MWKQIRLLIGSQSRNLLGINQIRFSKDRKKKNRLLMMAVVYVLLGIMLAFYSGLISFGLISIGLSDVVLAYALAVVSLVILFFTIIKAGSILFDIKTYDMLISLPIKSAAIVISRFMSMYLGNLAMGMVVMLPAIGVYAVMMRPGFLFYVMIVLGIILMPLFPMTVASAVGAGIAAVSSRMKHKNLVTIALTLGITIGVILLSMSTTSVEYQLTEDILRDVSRSMEAQIHEMYPLARWFADGVINHDLPSFLGFAGISVGTFTMLILLVQWKFVSICQALKSRTAGKNYQMQKLKQSHPVTALYKRELSRYFASNLYVVNTSVGYILTVIMGIGMYFAGMEKIETMMGLPGFMARSAPFLPALMCSMMPTTASAISMEGRQWWLAKSLPITSGQLFKSKILVNLTIALPCYVLAEIFFVMAIGNNFLNILWQLAIPLVYILFSTILGIAVNCKLPMLEWESDAAVVKQSGAVLAILAISFVSTAIPLALLLVFQTISIHLVMGTVCVILLGITLLTYRKLLAVDLRTIE